MSDKDIVIAQIREGFSEVEHPGGDFLQGSKEGCEPYEVVSPFKEILDWSTMDWWGLR